MCFNIFFLLDKISNKYQNNTIKKEQKKIKEKIIDKSMRDNEEIRWDP